jgi:hypothetical protein
VPRLGVDTQAKRIDAQRYASRFILRRPSLNRSATNRDRARVLPAAEARTRSPAPGCLPGERAA